MISIRIKENNPDAILQPPISKADALRIIAINRAFGRNFSLQEDSPDDVIIFADALEKLDFAASPVKLHMGLGAAPLRFFTAIAALEPGRIISINAQETLRQRPHAQLFDSLERTLLKQGAKLKLSAWPLQIDTTDLQLPSLLEFVLNPTSSQYLSALCLATARPLSREIIKEIRINLTGDIASAGYAELTAARMQQAGFRICQKKQYWEISLDKAAILEDRIPLDWSSIAYLLVFAWRTGCRVRLERDTLQPDSKIISILSEVGLQLSCEDDLLRITGELVHGIRVDCRSCPDLIPTLAVIALSGAQKSVFHGVNILRSKESDRLQFIQSLSEQLGGNTHLEGDTLHVIPPQNRRKIPVIKAENDHRRVMSGALLSVLGWPEVRIDHPEAVSKSFPGFWRELRKCGLEITSCL